MTSTWTKQKLGNLLTIKHGYAFKGQYFSNFGSHIVLTPGNFYDVGGFRRVIGKEKWYTGEIPREYVLSTNDLIVAMTEQGEGLLGSSALVPKDNLYLHNQRIGLILENKELIDRKLLFYLFNTEKVRKQIRGSANGSKVRHTSPKKIYDVEVCLPDLPTQKKIASILSTYDDLIENNKKRIKILEEMAQQLYTEWFVKFHFPGHEKVKLVDSHTSFGMIPEEWEVVSISKLAQFVNGYPFKPSELGTVGLPVVKIPELRSGILEKTPRNSGGNIAEKYRIKNGDILFSWSATLLVNVWNSGDALLNQHLFNVISRKDIYKTYLYYVLKILVDNLRGQVVGATMQHLRKGVVENGEVLLPRETILVKYNQQATSILETANNLSIKNQKLTSMRDLLIPQLITGKREVK
mgnify:CR=1 FL=1